MTSFGDRLRRAMDERGQLCAGVDPHASLLHDWGLADDPAGLESFALAATEALAPLVAAVKPQSAFYERHGSRGIAVLEKVIAVAHDAGAQVVLDVKRGDIGSTAQGYAEAYLDPAAPLGVDAITVSPYLGFGSLGPMVATATAHGTGLFVLARTSNPEATELQSARTRAGRSVSAQVLDHLRHLNEPAAGLGSFGAVVGATIELDEGLAADDLDMGGPLLVPGFGAQGGTVEGIGRVFAGVRDRVLASSSRGLLGAGPSPAALREAALRERDALGALVV